jgi:hypothetical protein
MAFSPYQSPKLPSMPISEANLIGKWKLEKVELYNYKDSLQKTITPITDKGLKDTTIELLANNKIKIIENQIINRDGISDMHTWSVSKNTLVIKKKQFEIPMKITSVSPKQVLLELMNPKADSIQHKAIIYFHKLN